MQTTISDISEQFARFVFRRLLAGELYDCQVQLERATNGLGAIDWPDNLIGELSAALDENGTDLDAAIAALEEWLVDGPELIRKILSDLLVTIRFFQKQRGEELAGEAQETE